MKDRDRIRLLESILNRLYAQLWEEYGEDGDGEPWDSMKEAKRLLTDFEPALEPGEPNG